MDKTEIKEILDHTYELFRNLEDNTNSEYLVKSIVFFASKYDFPLDELPEDIYEIVREKLHKEDVESYCDSLVECI